MPYSKIVGLGHHVPETVITNEYLSTVMDTSDAWIVERTGIKERRWMDPIKDTVANMAAKAARMALQNARLTEQDIDFIVFATITPDYFFPGSGVLLQRELGLDGRIAALDVRNACNAAIKTQFTLKQYAGAGKKIVGGDRCENNKVDVLLREPGVLKSHSGCFCRHVGHGVLHGIHPPTFFDARSFDDPGVACIHNGRKVFVGDHRFRNMVAKAYYFRIWHAWFLKWRAKVRKC